MVIVILSSSESDEVTLARQLGKLDETVLAVKSNIEVGLSVQNRGVDLVVLAVDAMTAAATSRLIRSMDRLVPILVVTSSTDTPARVAALDSGADALLTPPYAEEELLLRARELMRRQL